MDVTDEFARKRAFVDGALIDVTRMAKEFELREPTAVTRAVRETCVRMSKGTSKEEIDQRLWEILFALSFFVSRDGESGEKHFPVWVRDQGEAKPVYVTLKAIFGPGRGRKRAITIMLPHETMAEVLSRSGGMTKNE